MSSEGNKPWERPKSVPFPSVWRTYVGKQKLKDGNYPKFKIQDVPDDLHDDLINFMTTVFLRDENISISLNIKEDKVSIKEFQEAWRKILAKKIVLIALVDDGNVGKTRPRIAGANMTGITHKWEKINSDKFQGEGMRKMIKFGFEKPSSVVDVFELYGVEEYMSALGLCVHPDFREQGLGREILAARYDIGKAVGLKVTVSIFSSIPAMKAAAGVGMKDLVEVLYDDCIEDGKVVFQDMKCNSMKFMGSRI